MELKYYQIVSGIIQLYLIIYPGLQARYVWEGLCVDLAGYI